MKVKSEDQVVEIVSTWLDAHFNEIDIEMEKEVFEMMKHIRWTYVSFEKMLEIFRMFGFMRSNTLIKSIFSNEFKVRATRSKHLYNHT